MSRSIQHTPITGITTAKSEKFSKQQWNRSYRHWANRAEDPPRQPRRNEREGSKDGKAYWREGTSYMSVAEMMRK